MSSGITVSGAVSGIDTASIINQLVSVQQNQQNLLKQEQSGEQKASDAYGSLITALGNLGTLAGNVANTAAWKGSSASSSSTSVTATATSNLTSSLTFDVTALAQAHTVVSHESVASLSSAVAGSSITVTKNDGTTSTINVGSGSLSDVVSAINGSSSGLTAAAVQTGPGAYRLQIASATTGAASEFTVSGLTGFSGMDVLTQGSDAQLTVGTNPATQYTATSSTNTFASLVPGVSFTVSKLETGVTVGSKVDGSAVAGDIQKLVDSANSVLTSISSATAWNATTKTGGPLVGDSTVRNLQQSILSLVGGTNAPGIQLTKDGSITFDVTAFTTAYAKDPAGTAARFGATGTFTKGTGVTGTATFSSATSSTQAGTYAVTVTSAAAKEQWTAAVGATPAPGTILSLTRGSSTVSYTVAATDTLSDVVTNLNAALSSAKFGVTAAVNGSNVTLTADATGTASAFTATYGGAAQTKVTAGANVAGTINGEAATGVGDVLSLGSGTTGAVGLAVNLSGITAADVVASGGKVGSFTYTPGLAQRFTQLINQQTASGTGMLASAKQGRLDAVKRLQDQIDAWDTRLSAYRATLQSQFTAMETSMAQLKTLAASLGQASTSSGTTSTGG